MLGSKKRLGVTFKGGICNKLCLKLWFESEWYTFVILMSQDGFESNCPEAKFQTITS